MEHVGRGGRVEATPLRAWLDAFAYTFHTQVFFFVAGMVLPDPSRPGFFGQAGRRLVYPYVLWGTAQGFIVAFAGSAANFPIAPRDVLPSLLFAPGHQFWFLYVLIVMTLLTGFALRMGWERRDVLLASIVLFVLQMRAPGPPAVRWTGFHAVYFASGLCMGLGRPLPSPWVIPAAFGALAIVVTFGWKEPIALRPLYAGLGIAGTLALAQAWPNRAGPRVARDLRGTRNGLGAVTSVAVTARIRDRPRARATLLALAHRGAPGASPLPMAVSDRPTALSSGRRACPCDGRRSHRDAGPT